MGFECSEDSVLPTKIWPYEGQYEASRPNKDSWSQSRNLRVLVRATNTTKVDNTVPSKPIQATCMRPK